MRMCSRTMHSRCRGTSPELLNICSAKDACFARSNTTTDLLHAPHLGYRKCHCFDGRVNCRLAECCRLGRGGFVKLHNAGAPLEYLRDIANREQTANCLIHWPPPPEERHARFPM